MVMQHFCVCMVEWHGLMAAVPSQNARDRIMDTVVAHLRTPASLCAAAQVCRSWYGGFAPPSCHPRATLVPLSLCAAAQVCRSWYGGTVVR